MKESKCGKIPPCYGSLEFAIYEEAKKVNDEWEKSRALHGKMIDKLRAKLMEGGFADYYESLDADDILSIEILEDKNNEFVDCSEPCPEIKAVQELLRNSKHLKDKIIVITKDNAAIL